MTDFRGMSERARHFICDRPWTWATPSPEDKQITDQLSAAGTLLGIVLDHIIIGDGQYASLRELGHLGR